nr:retrotransposon protein, putative, unclassified [Tanacetum cinerariifolium]
MKSSTTNVETSINEEVFHEVSESFQGESSLSSLNDDVQQSPEEVILPQTNTQSISINMIPNVDEGSTSHNVFNKRLEDAYFDATKAFRDVDWVSAMQEELDQFARLKVWRLVPRPEGKSVIKTKWIFKNKKDESSLVIRNKARLVAVDVKTAFPNGILKEEVYVGQPPVPTPMVEQAKLKHDLVGKPVDHTDYRSDKLVCWSSKKQNCVFISTAESEYVVVSSCCAQVFWMRTQLTDYGFFYDKVLIYCDSKSAIATSCNPV